MLIPGPAETLRSPRRPDTEKPCETVLSKLIAIGWGREESSGAIQAMWRGGIGEARLTMRWLGKRADDLVNDLHRLLQ